jgi:hypothetical protein
MTDDLRERYFDLPASDQADLLQSLAPVMGRRAEILEKDIWLCQVLDTLPQSTLAIAPDVAVHVPGLALPTAQVSVLSAARTFWEKATLIHVECHRPGQETTTEKAAAADRAASCRARMHAR